MHITFNLFFIIIILTDARLVLTIQATSVADPPPPPKNRLEGSPIEGWVTKVSNKSLTLTLISEQPAQAIQTMDGIQIGWSTHGSDQPSEAAKLFIVNSRLAGGGHPSGGLILPYQAYRLNDIHVGDRVSITSRSINDVYVCDSISILRRPGGKVPPSPGDPEMKYNHHINSNALQESESSELLMNRASLDRKIISFGFVLVNERFYEFDSNGPWYIRILIPPQGCYWQSTISKTSVNPVRNVAPRPRLKQ